MWKPNAPKMASASSAKKRSELLNASSRMLTVAGEEGDGLILVGQLIAQCGGETEEDELLPLAA